MSALTGQHSTTQEPLTATASQATSDPVRDQNTSDLSPESRPELGMNGVTDGTTAAAPTGPNVSNVTKEEKVGKGEVAVESRPINEGILNYKGPGLKGLIFSKKYFWLSDSPLEHGHLSEYLSNEKTKDIAHPNAAHATQTGKGLLFYAKRAEDKGHPQGMFNLADVTDVAKGNFNDFGFTLNGHKHNFQAINKSEKDAWLVTIETKASEARTAREGIVGSSGYKSQLEKYGAGAAATTGTSRSRSRGMMASKSSERKAKDTTSHTGPEAATTASATKPETATGATTTSDAPSTFADKTTGTTSGTTTNTATGTTTGEHVGEAAAGGAAVGAVAAAAATRSGSASEEEKSKATKKSRSQSRNNKRSSIFGGLLGKKEDRTLDKEEKKEEKAEEKAVKKELKKEDKADLKELKKEEKAEKKEEKAIRHEDKAAVKDIKHQGTAEKLAEKRELKEEAKLPGVAKTGDFDAVAVASRVVGEPLVPAGEPTASASGVGLVAGADSAVAESTSTSTARDTVPKPNKRNSIFGNIFGKKDAPTLASADTPPTVPAKDEQSTVSPTAPQLDNPVTSSTAETTAATTESPTTAAESTLPAATTSPTAPADKRRTSFFGNLGTKKERRTGASSDNELTDGEGKKASSGGFGGLLRKASRAQKGSSSAASKDANNVPLPTETPAEATTNGETLAEKAATTEGKTATHEQKPVSATA